MPVGVGVPVRVGLRDVTNELLAVPETVGVGLSVPEADALTPRDSVALEDGVSLREHVTEAVPEGLSV